MLVSRSSEEVILAERHNPNLFFETRAGLYVWNDFRSRIVANAKPTEKGTKFRVDVAELMRDLNDEEIERGLPKEHLFDETQVCAIIASFIAKQPNGEKGKLVNNGYANLFYMVSCVVGIGWYAGSRRWRVSVYDRCNSAWDAGGRVFSPATET